MGNAHLTALFAHLLDPPPCGRPFACGRNEKYSREEIIGLFEFIDWVLQLSNEEEDQLWEEVKTLQEENKMPYITSVERIGMRKGREEGLQLGLQQGLQQGLLETLDVRFGIVPVSISDDVGQIQEPDRLRTLLRWAIRSASLEEFQQALNDN